jgi:hypothetical protein
MFCVQVRVVMCHFSYHNFMSHNMVLVLAVLAQASECPRNHHMGGEIRGTTVNVDFIVSVGSGSPCNF